MKCEKRGGFIHLEIWGSEAMQRAIMAKREGEECESGLYPTRWLRMSDIDDIQEVQGADFCVITENGTEVATSPWTSPSTISYSVDGLTAPSSF